MTTVSQTLSNRGQSYGEYADGTKIAMDIYERIQGTPGFANMNPGQRYAMFMFAAKIARICNGDVNHADSWLDIAGYATLVHDRLETKNG